MRGAAAAIAWEFRRHHRWGFTAIVVYLSVLALAKVVALANGWRFLYHASGEMFAFTVLVPVTATFVYCLVVFTYGYAGDLTARTSIFPPRLFTLPMTATELAGWPMLYGCATVVALWILTRFVIPWPADFIVPRFWPALLGASLVAWTQALAWASYPLAGLRIAVTAAWLVAIDTIMLIALQFHASETLMIGLLAPHVPLAYLVARRAVASARRGDVAEWRRDARSATGEVSSVLATRFTSAHAAQRWYEWRQYGRSLPSLVAMVIPFEVLLFWTTGVSRGLVFEVVLLVLFTPAVMATFVGATVSRTKLGATGISPFLATRPVTSAALIGARLVMSLQSTAFAWLIVAVVLPAGLAWSGRWIVVEEFLSNTARDFGVAHTAAIVAIVVSVAVLATWRQLVQSLYVSLTGQPRLVRARVILTLVVIVFIGPLLQWIDVDPHGRTLFWSSLLWGPGLLVAFKMSIASWVAIRLHRTGVVSPRVQLASAAAWTAAVFAVFLALVWFFQTPFIPRFQLLCLAMLLIPLARLSASPLALHSNRHQ